MHAYFINKIAFNLEGNKRAELNKDVGCEKWEMRMKSEKINPGSFHKNDFHFCTDNLGQEILWTFHIQAYLKLY